MIWYFLQEPRVAIGVAEGDIFNATHIVNLAHFNAPFGEGCAGCLYVSYHEVQGFN